MPGQGSVRSNISSIEGAESSTHERKRGSVVKLHELGLPERRSMEQRLAGALRAIPQARRLFFSVSGYPSFPRPVPLSLYVWLQYQITLARSAGEGTASAPGVREGVRFLIHSDKLKQ
jgi:hypothetical protein